jgi:hypothetical protein
VRAGWTSRAGRYALAGLALALLGLGGLGPLAAILLGAAGWRRCRRTGESGTALAVASMLAGTVLLFGALASALVAAGRSAVGG